MIIGVVNQSPRVDTTSANLMVSAVAKQMSQQAAPAWGQTAATVQYYSNINLVPSSAYPIVILPNSDYEGALGYHTEENGHIFGRVFVNDILDNGGSVLGQTGDPSLSVSACLSHEALELWGDRFCTVWGDGTEIEQGSEYAWELCDPVEADYYFISGTYLFNKKTITKNVAVSNFILPAWFDSQDRTHKYDFRGKLSAPFTMTPYGYMIVRNGPGTEQAVFGDKYPKDKLERKKSALSRTFRRGTKPTSLPVKSE